MTGLVAINLQFRLAAHQWGPWSFSFPKPSIVGIVGPNGSGKTSFFKTLLGFPMSQKGTLTLDGLDLIQCPSSMRKYLWSILPQTPVYPEEWTIESSIEFVLKAQEDHPQTKAFASKADEYLSLLDLQRIRKTRMSELSPGERQRVFLCQALLKQSKGTLLDEPTNHLDAHTRKEFWQIVSSILMEKVQDQIILIISHELEELKKVCNFVLAVSKEKRLVYAGPAQEFWSKLEGLDFSNFSIESK